MFEALPYDLPQIGAASLAFQRTGTATITLDRMGDTVTTVDAELLPELLRYRWARHECDKGKVYARAQRCPITKATLCLYMHRHIASLVLPPPPRAGMVVDHINGDGLDKRACNLRWLDAVVNRWGTAKHGRPRDARGVYA